MLEEETGSAASDQTLMSAQADPPVQKETEETGGDSQPDVTLSSHNSMGNLDPALGQSVQGSHHEGDHDPAPGQAGKGSQQLGDHDPALGQTGKGSQQLGDRDPALGQTGKGSQQLGDSGSAPVKPAKGSHRFPLRQNAGGYRELSLPPTVSGGRGTEERDVATFSAIFEQLDPETSAALELSLAANGMEHVLTRVLKGKEVMERDPPTSKPDLLVPGRDYVAADGTVMQEYFDGTDDEEDEPLEQGSAEDILAQRQVPDVTGDRQNIRPARV